MHAGCTFSRILKSCDVVSTAATAGEALKRTLKMQLTTFLVFYVIEPPQSEAASSKCQASQLKLTLRSLMSVMHCLVPGTGELNTSSIES